MNKPTPSGNVCLWIGCRRHDAFRLPPSPGKLKIPTSPCPLWLCGESIYYHLKKIRHNIYELPNLILRSGKIAIYKTCFPDAGPAGQTGIPLKFVHRSPLQTPQIQACACFYKHTHPTRVLTVPPVSGRTEPKVSLRPDFL